VGPKRKKALLKAFGSVKRLRAASVEEIAAVPGVGKTAAQAIAETLR
jgi:excinuclease ABC subunit C